MLKQYQQAFYDMAVAGQSETLMGYTGTLQTWQVRVYQNNYRQSLKSSLYKKYKHLVNLFEGNIDSLFSDYIATNPSWHNNLALYGDSFSSWLEAYQGTQVQRFILDVATLDQLLFSCYYAENADNINLQEFANLTASQQVSYEFIRKPSVTIMASKWDLKAILEGGPYDQNVHEGLKRYYVIYRAEGIACWKEISYSLFRLLDYLNVEMSLNQLERIFGKEEVKPAMDQDFLTLIKMGWVTQSPTAITVN